MVNVGLKLVRSFVAINATSSGMVDADMLPLQCCYCTDKLLLSPALKPADTAVVELAASLFLHFVPVAGGSVRLGYLAGRSSIPRSDFCEGRILKLQRKYCSRHRACDRTCGGETR